MVDKQRRAERRRCHYEKFKTDPAQFLQVIFKVSFIWKWSYLNFQNLVLDNGFQDFGFRFGWANSIDRLL